MRVHAIPATITVATDAQLADVVFADDRANGDLVLFQRWSAGSWRPVTARQFAADVGGLAAGFLAAGSSSASESRCWPPPATSGR